MRYYRIFIVILIFGLVISGHIKYAEAKKVTPVKVAQKIPHYTRIFYYQGGKDARTSFTRHIKSIDVIAPQSYSIDSDGTLKGSVNADLLVLARRNHVKVMPLVTNDGFNSSSTQAFLDNQAKQEAAIKTLVNEAIQKKFWGWQIDFEQMDVSYRDKFSAFVKNCNDAFKENNLMLSVAVVSQISANPDDYITDKHADLWQRLIGVYDYAALASSTDFVSIMSYDDPWSKGPPARFLWVRQVLAYALRFIPPQKLSLGIPLYYWQWNDATGKHVGIGGYAGVKNILNKYRVRRGYDTTNQAAFIHYKKKRIHYTIWYENARSIKQDIGLITQYDLHGFSAWALGLESPDIFGAARR